MIQQWRCLDCDLLTDSEIIAIWHTIFTHHITVGATGDHDV